MNDRFLNDLKSAIGQAVHQCNNHLSIILSNCELGLMIQDSALAKKKLESNISRVNQMTDLLVQLNKLASVNAEIKTENLAAFFENSLRQIEALAAARQIECKTTNSAYGDVSLPSQVLQLILELTAQNAIYNLSSTTDKRISVSVTSTDSEITILITNNGPSFETAEPEKFFSSYFATSAASTNGALGTVRSLTAQLGGKISYSNKNSINEILIQLPTTYEDDI